MHQQFPDWYRLADQEPREEMLEDRWSGVQRLLRWHEKNKWLDCVRLFFGHPFSEVDSHESVVEIMRKDDGTFPSRDNELEVQILTGAAILSKVGNPSRIADLVSLAVTCAYCNGNCGDVVIKEVIEESHRYLQERGRDVREETDAKDYFAEISTGTASFADVGKLDEELGNTNQRQANVVNNRLQTTNAHFNALLQACKSLSGQLSSLANNVGKAAERMVEDRLGALEEELDILWWLFGERSREQIKPFAEMKTPEMVLAASHELAEKTTRVPGPPSIEAFVGKALLISAGGNPKVLKKKVSFEDFAESARPDWREKRATSLRSHGATLEDFAPALCSIFAAEEVGGDGWTTYYKRKTGLDATTSMRASDLAMQAYNEALLLSIA